MKKQIALVTGGNRGIGLQIAKDLANRGMKVILTARDEKKGSEATDQLNEYGQEIIFHQLDVSDSDSIMTIANYIQKEFGRLDILVNNAGIYVRRSPSKVSEHEIKSSMDVNFIGPWLLTQQLIHLIEKSKSGRVINVSSGAGQMESSFRSHSPYKISKLALNGLTRLFAEEFPTVSINAMCPGWVRTDMGGAGANRSVEEGADTVIWLSTMEDPPSGNFYRDRKVISW